MFEANRRVTTRPSRQDLSRGRPPNTPRGTGYPARTPLLPVGCVGRLSPDGAVKAVCRGWRRRRPSASVL